MNTRAFFITVNRKRFLSRKIVSITISDGLNEITLLPHEYFLIESDEPINKKLITKDVH